MLFIQSNNLSLLVAESDRLGLIDALASRGHSPLVRSARRHFFQLLAGWGKDAAVGTTEFESEYMAGHESGRDRSYTPGELFGASDCVLYFVLDEDGGLTAGVIYDIETAEPLAKLERFCLDLRSAFASIKGEEAKEAAAGSSTSMTRGGTEGGSAQRGLARFMELQPADYTRVSAAIRGGRALTRASELMEERAVRLFLRSVQEIRREGYSPRRLFAEASALGVSVEKMLEAGLLEPEVRVSCRKSGHALFDLPSSDSLAAITISKAKCSLCAAPVADEVIEETVNPTRLALSLLEDGRWLANRVYNIIRSLGLPESEIATGPSSTYGESYLVANVCGAPFLFAIRDGDLTPAYCRRVAEMVNETEASQLVVVVMGAVEDEGRLRLYEFAWRRARAGHDLGTTLVEGLSGAQAQVAHVFEGAVRRELSHRLIALDAALGFSASNFVLDWFKVSKTSGEKKHEFDYASVAASEWR